MGTLILVGRGVDERDTESSRRVAVINETIARRYWHTPEKALGQRFKTSKDGPWIEIAGVAQNGKYLTLGEPPTPYFFLPLTQDFQARVTFLVRSKEAPESLVPALRQAVSVLDPTLPIFGVRTMPQFLNRIVSVYDMEATMVGAFGVTALLLAVVGIYGVLHFAVARRTREIGIRMALGAGRRDIVRLILSRSMIFVLAGLAFGIVGSLAASSMIGKILGGVSATDPLTFTAVAVLFTLVALAASAIPARRASRIDPMEAVRYE
jgi:predicted permease